MKVTFSEMLERSKWFHKELLASLDGDVIFENGDTKSLEVELLINGKTYNPEFLEDLYKNIEKYIEYEAKEFINEKLEDAENEASKLLEIISDCKSSIIDKFEI